MSSLRELWKGEKCQIRLEGCTINAVELAHLRTKGITGMGLKAPDFLGAWACRNCHNATESNPDMLQAFLEGMARTQEQLIKRSKVKISLVNGGRG